MIFENKIKIIDLILDDKNIVFISKFCTKKFEFERVAYTMSKFDLSSYSETDSYDSECDNPHNIHHPSISSLSDTTNSHEFKIEVSELLSKFGEYSNLGTLFSCKYIHHPITSGLLLYIPYHRLIKYRDGSLTICSESDCDPYDSTNENRYTSKLIKDRVKKIYLQRGKSKNDVSYARMVKKPRILRYNYKDEMRGKRQVR